VAPTFGLHALFSCCCACFVSTANFQEFNPDLKGDDVDGGDGVGGDKEIPSATFPPSFADGCTLPKVLLSGLLALRHVYRDISSTL
jgi:hypothetical protein